MTNKRALVLAGGGSKGAFEVGVLKSLIGDKLIQYDIITGVSVGALNASFLSQFPIGKEQESIATLEAIWDNISQKNIYKRHFPFGKFAALWKSSVYDSSPLKDFVYDHLDVSKVSSSGKNLIISACSVMTGEVKTWNESDLKNIRDAVLASSSFPVMFEPIDIDGDLFTDAGVKEIAPLTSAIKAGADVIDVVITSPVGSHAWNVKKRRKNRKPNALKILLRSTDLMSDEILMNDLENIEKINKKILEGKADPKYRYIEINLYQPKEVLTENSLNFDRKLLNEMKKIGYEVGKNYAADKKTT